MKLFRPAVPWLALLSLASAIVIVLGSQPGKADPPADADREAVRHVLADHSHWVREKPDGRDFHYWVDMHLTAVESERHWTSFSSCKLEPEEDHREGERREHHREKSLVGDCKQYFDSTWPDPLPPDQKPFASSRVDDLGIVLDIEAGTLIVTLHSWGNGETVVPLVAGNGVLYGFKDNTMYIIDLKDAKAPRGSEKPVQ